jgi:hypothetical protein
MSQRLLICTRSIAVPAITFALGWALKPDAPQARGHSRNSTPGASAADHAAQGRHPAKAGASAGASTEATAGSAARLTSVKIEELGRAYRTATDPIARREAFAKLIAGLTAETALEIRAQIEHLGSNDPDFRDFHFAWGKVGGVDAVLHGTQTDKSDMAPTLAGWAAANPAAARAWFQGLDPKSDQHAGSGSLKEALVHGLAIASPSAASEYVIALGENGDRDAKRMMRIIAEKVMQSGGSGEAATWATALPAGELRGQALYEVARTRAREDPASAAAWATRLAGDPNSANITYGISMEWGGRDGAATVRWLESLAGDQSAAYGAALGSWTRSDPLAASQYIADMTPSSGRDQAIGGLVSSHRWEDPAAAVAWAGQISDPQRRQEVLAQAAEAYVRKDPAGAAAWLPASGLPEETVQRLQRRR